MRALAFMIAALTAGAEAHAETPFLGGQLRGLLDIRASMTDGERGWLDGGFGKLRHGGAGGGFVGELELARGALVWRRPIGWAAEAYAQLEIDPDHDQAVDIGEVYVRLKPVPNGALRYALRAGVFYPPVSLEHDGPAWSATRTLTPSAINSWIGEEVKIAALEATARGSFGAHELGVTGAVFGFNDTAGTLLTFRGWAMHDRQATVFGDFRLPERDEAFWAARSRQARATEPFREIDGRVGFFARLEWRPDAPVVLDLSHYDNAGDRVAVEDGQSAWETRFTNLGLRAQLAERTELLAQAMTGQTIWIPLAGRPIAFVDDLDFAAAYVLVDHRFGEHGVAARLDAFETSDNQAFNYNATPEDGWALTAAWRRSFAPSLTLMVEGARVSSERAAREADGLDARQDQFSLQSSLLWSF